MSLLTFVQDSVFTCCPRWIDFNLSCDVDSVSPQIVSLLYELHVTNENRLDRFFIETCEAKSERAACTPGAGVSRWLPCFSAVHPPDGCEACLCAAWVEVETPGAGSPVL